MNNHERARRIAVRLNAAEDQLTSIRALVNEDFIDGIGGHSVFDPLDAKLQQAIDEVNELHGLALAAAKGAGDVSIYSGGGGGK